jgi:hypothetical protein
MAKEIYPEDQEGFKMTMDVFVAVIISFWAGILVQKHILENISEIKRGG